MRLAEAVVGDPSFQENPAKEAFLALSKAYQKMFRQTRRLIHISDKQQHTLLSLNKALDKARQEADQARQEADLARQEADLANRKKSDFLANMSHEIRTPMNAILGLTHLGLQTETSPQQQDYLEKTLTSTHALLRIINDILDFSKIDAGKMEVESIPFHLNHVLNDLSTLVSSESQREDLEIIFAMARGVPGTLQGDPVRLGQVLINLLNNALKFTRSGEIVLSVNLMDKRDGHATLRFSIRDTGIGMVPDQITRLFQAFSQADGSTTRKYGGTGLGLTISKRLVELMGGTIWVESMPGQGSTFFFTARFGWQKNASTTAMQVPADLVKKRVLVIDDNQASQEMLHTTLTSFALQVTVASTGMEGLTQLEKMSRKGKPFDLLLLDWRMPNLDGVQTFHCLKSLKNSFHLPTLFMAPHTEQARIRQQIGDIQPEAYLDKPVHRAALFDAIMALFGKEKPPPAMEKRGQTLALHPNKTVSGAKVLLVEDNEINQQVGKELLEMARVVVDIAHNGQEAVEKVAQNTYALVLMDIQMPVMDGYQATRTIRKRPQHATLPIVAMTANVMVQDLANCWEAGMNGHIAKPIDPKKLFYTLNAWIKPRKGASPHLKENADGTHQDTTATPQDATAEVHTVLPDMPGINIKFGLSCVSGKIELFQSLLVKFLENHETFSVDIQKALQDGKTDLVRRMAHTLKGVAGTIGALRLQEMARDVEASLVVTAEFEKELALVLDTIRKAHADTPPDKHTTPPQKTSPVDPAVVLKTLETLASHIKKNRPKNCQTALNELAHMSLPGTLPHDMETLTKLIKKYKMKEAGRTLDALITHLKKA